MTEDEAADLIVTRKAYYLDYSGWRVAYKKDDMGYDLYRGASAEEGKRLTWALKTLGPAWGGEGEL
jgi:hypothetical protein